MKSKYILIVVAVVAFVAICYKLYSGQQREKMGKNRYEMAYSYFKQSELGQASLILDSLYSEYSGVRNVIFLADQLKIRINKKLYTDSIAAIDLRIYSTDSVEIEVLQEQKSRLERIYANLLIEENKYSCPQCAVYMQNLRSN